MRPELPFVARPLVEALNLATVSLLPPRLRDELGLDWGPNRRRLVARRADASSGALCRCCRAYFASSRRRAAPTGAWLPQPE